MTDIAIKIDGAEFAALHTALQEGGYAAFQKSARELWAARGHSAQPGAVFEAKRQADWDSWYLTMRTTT